MKGLKLVPRKRMTDKFAWRCMTTVCQNYKNYTSIRKYSFFDSLNIKLKDIMLILVKYGSKQQRYQIESSFNYSRKTIEKVLNKLVSIIPKTDFSSNKLGGPGTIVQIDETMLNFKCKSHRGRAPSNRTDSLCIVEINRSITRAYATIIPNKKENTIIPIICSQVASNTRIYTDEHKSYSNLRHYDYFHNTMCHKYEFVNSIINANTQAVESFNNCLKLDIKKRKGIKTEKRESFLNEFLFFFNNRNNLLYAIFNLIKI
ncbi:hypothetical protein H312_01791 [Anncaliia algerae PRA339]|uniref:ISXO2-like transposase domain-containing protein n=1 Tax=Anncaliia algerae PRA339 TaxID=1288291 RepID=A0A059F1A1_9MICR|nr:hypothetical protein H312_01791 [Anncaliia algerae PRA339]